MPTVQPSLLQVDAATPPGPRRIPHTLTSVTGEVRTDPYYWLNQRDNPEVIAYLEAENRYADTILKPLEQLREQLYQEMRSRMKEDDVTVPYRKNGYWYGARYVSGKEYPIYFRKKENLDAEEEILADVNMLAQNKPYCQLGGIQVSPDNALMAYSVDYSGRGLYTLYVKNLVTGAQLPDSFPVGSNFYWANDSKTLLYDTKDSVTLRNDKIWRHVIGTDHKNDVLMYHEKDDTQYAYLEKSNSEAYFFIQSGYTETVEVHFLDANEPTGKFTKVHPRSPGLFYSIEHWNDQFLIRTNKDAPNFRIMQTPISKPGLAHWTDLIAHREDVLIESFAVFEQHLVTTERKNGLNQLHITRMDDQSDHYIQTGEPTYSCAIDNNPEFKTQTLRYSFTSPKTPTTIIDYDMETRKGTVKKVAPVLGGYDPNLYETAFVWAPARDGASVPISLIYKKGLPRDGSAPCFLTGYGSYGYSYDPYFNRDKVSLLNRGFVVGIAHIRGGMEMGYMWYEQGKMLQKVNTFTDFIDCSEFLIREGYTASDRLFAEGRSAGGLLMGAIANMRPDLYKGILTGVPFVDVITTMSDPSIPLTTGEYTEWGNPNDPGVYNYMKSYSPYDNLRAADYPNMLVTTSFADSQVQYFEPAKYVARLRDLKTDKNILLFKTNMAGSHGGSSGRFKRLEERALEYAWMLGLLGMKGS